MTSERRHGPERGRDGVMVPLEPPRSFDSPLHAQGILVLAPRRLAFVSGQVGVRPDGTAVIGAAEQTQVAFDNLVRVLAEADLRLEDLASMRASLTDPDDIGVFTDVARERLGGHRPASTLVVVERLADPSLHVQIEAVAVGR